MLLPCSVPVLLTSDFEIEGFDVFSDLTPEARSAYFTYTRLVCYSHSFLSFCRDTLHRKAAYE